MTDTQVLSIRVDREKWRRIAEIAGTRGCRNIEVIRDAIDAYLGAAAVLSNSQLRLARITEFTQIAVDIIIREQYPEYRDRIVAEADKRLGQFHGA